LSIVLEVVTAEGKLDLRHIEPRALHEETAKMNREILEGKVRSYHVCPSKLEPLPKGEG